jgi:hypothetical protein
LPTDIGDVWIFQNLEAKDVEALLIMRSGKNRPRAKRCFYKVFGKIFHVGKQPINAQAGAYHNVEKPDSGADWELRLQLQFLFPK